MNFVPLGSPDWLSIIVGGILGLAPLVLIGFAGKTKTVNTPGNAFMMAGVGLAAIFMVMFGLNAGSSEQQREAKELIEKSYGLELSVEEMQELTYPDKTPAEALKVYGSISRDSATEEGFTRNKLFLIWKGDRMILAQSDDGENFTELTTLDR